MGGGVEVGTFDGLLIGAGYRTSGGAMAYLSALLALSTLLWLVLVFRNRKK